MQEFSINKPISLLVWFLFSSYILLFIPQTMLANELNLEQGIYSIEYEILRADNDSVSIANDYFDKPAYIIVDDDKTYIQFSINHSEWTKELQAPYQDEFLDVEVLEVNENEDTRIVQFELDRSIEEPLEFKMHVLIEEMEPVYDHRYTVRFDFDQDTIEEAGEDDVILSKSIDQNYDTNGQDHNNHKLIILTVSIFVVTILLVIIFTKIKKRRGNNEE